MVSKVADGDLGKSDDAMLHMSMKMGLSPIKCAVFNRFLIKA